MKLNAREQQVVKGVASGETQKVIAASLQLSPKTIEMYVSRIYRKTEVNNIVDLTKWALRHGLTTL